MAVEQFANNAQTTLASSIIAGATSLTVTSATGFPSSPQFRIQIGNELLLVTAVAGATWTVTRGIESTTAAAHSAGDTVTQVLTAGAMSGISGGGGVFGDGSDGSLTYDGSTTILGMAPVANVYTLTRDIWASTITVNNGVTIKPAGFRIFCSGTLTNNGTIQNDGGNGGSGTSTLAGAAGTAGAANETWGPSNGTDTTAGAAGARVTTASRTNGAAATGLTPACIGGSGGSGGSATGGLRQPPGRVEQRLLRSPRRATRGSAPRL
ncbi:MAG: hypothetical protein U0792_17985 [Gemmataceae bacterium]